MLLFLVLPSSPWERRSVLKWPWEHLDIWLVTVQTMCCLISLGFLGKKSYFLLSLFFILNVFSALYQSKSDVFVLTVFVLDHKNDSFFFFLCLCVCVPLVPGISCVTVSRPWGERCLSPWLSSPSPTLVSIFWTPSANFLTMLTQRCLITPSLPWAWWAVVSPIEGMVYSD